MQQEQQYYSITWTAALRNHRPSYARQGGTSPPTGHRPSTGWTMQAFKPGMNNTTFVFSKTSTPALRSTLNGDRRFSPQGLSGQGVMRAIHFHIVPKLRMCGATPPLPIYTFMAWTQTNLRSSWSSDISEMLSRHNAARVAHAIQTVIKSTKFLRAHSHTFVRTATTQSLPFANWEFKNRNIHKYNFCPICVTANLVHHIYGRARNEGQLKTLIWQ